jgi:two-component system sensor histidine kinase MprB
VLAAVALGLTAAVTSLVAFAVVRSVLLREADQALAERARAAVESPLADPVTLARVPAGVLGAGDLRIALQFADGRAVSSQGAASAPPLGTAELAVARGELASSVRTGVTGGATFRVVAVPAADGVALVLAQPTAGIQRVLAALGAATAVTAVAGVVLGAVLGTRIARSGLRPVERLTEAAEAVATTGRLEPIPVSGDDELARLARSFNAMLAAVEASRDRERRLIADAGHELRTPLTSLRTNLDLLAQTDAGASLTAADRAALLADVRAQGAELTALVADLVELARDDPPSAARVPTDLAEVVRAGAERVRRRAPAVAVEVDLQPFTVDGDPALLERAVTNLLDNAVKWSPPGGGRVDVTLDARPGAGTAVLRVADNGPGIHPDDLPHVFDRFFRSTEARALPGSGLGLAIVRQCAERHGGTARALARPGGGALLELELPGRPGAPAG